eukprot:842358-Amphidinium_carterae.1
MSNMYFETLNFLNTQRTYKHRVDHNANANAFQTRTTPPTVIVDRIKSRKDSRPTTDSDSRSVHLKKSVPLHFMPCKRPPLFCEELFNTLSGHKSLLRSLALPKFGCRDLMPRIRI